MHPSLLLFAVLAPTVYGQLMIKSRGLVHSSEPVARADKLHHLYLMFTAYCGTQQSAAAILAGLCWTLAIKRLKSAMLIL